MRVVDLKVMSIKEALIRQERLVAGKLAGERGDYLLLVEHPPVYTTGRGGDRGNFPSDGAPVIRLNRGGDVTFHGPGQLVAYPVLDLNDYDKDLGRYLRTLETAVIATVRAFGLTASRRDGLTGVWTKGGKIASIAIGCRRWVVWHGLALNVDVDLSYFDRIVPCGLPDVSVTSMTAELGREVKMPEVKRRLRQELKSALSGLKSGRRVELNTSALAKH